MPGIGELVYFAQSENIREKVENIKRREFIDIGCLPGDGITELLELL